MSSVIIAGDTSGTITLQAPAASGSSVLTLPVATDTLVGKATTDTLTNKTLTAPALGTPASGILTSCTGLNYDGFKNRIINGAMTIAQRATSVTGANGYCCTDRYDLSASTIVWNASQSTDVPSTTGFRYSTSLTVTTASSASGAYAYIYHAIEGYNWADLSYGTASAQTSTLSFWVKSSVTGTYGIALRNTGTARFYTTTYTINSANTWEQKTITITGDTSGTWNTTNGSGIQLFWDLGVGSTYSSTSNNAWSTVGSNYFGVTGATKLGATNGATFYITGVQLEKGSTATSFDYRPYGTELALCQRYYFKNTGAAYAMHGSGTVFSTVDADIYTKFPVSMRTIPTVSLSSTQIQVGATIYAATGIGGAAGVTTSGAFSRVTTGGVMVVGYAAVLTNANNASGYLDATSEL